MDRGLVFNIQRYSLHDGPGIRTTVFLKGCPLSCNWCHNPESQPRHNEIRVLDSRCARCGHCVDVCPQGGRDEDHLRITGATHRAPSPAARDCTLCAACIDACPTGARQMAGREMSVAEVVDEVLLDQMFHDQSSGGATLSGGEPLAQAPFLLRLLKALRGQAIHTALDTCGFAPRQVVLDVAPWVDLFLYDLKSMDDTAHRAQTGVSNALILENLKTLSSVHANIWIRVPLIPGFNLDDVQLRDLARFAASLPGVQQVNLLPYHRMGTGKSKGVGKPRQVESVTTDGALGLRGVDARLVNGISTENNSVEDISQEQIDQAARLFRAAGLRTMIGG